MRKIFLFFIATLFSVSMWANCYVAGSFNNWAADVAEMTNVSGTYYVAKIQISSGIDAYEYVQFKVVDNGGWYGDGTSFTASNLHSWKELSTSGGNMSLKVEESGTYFTFIYNQETKYFAVIFPDTKIIAAGSDALFGSDWSASDTNNALTSTDNYTFTWSVSDYDLAVGDYYFKVVIDEDWDHKAYPGSNEKIAIATSGSYDVTITFNALTLAVSKTVTLKDAHPVVPAMKLCRKWALEPGQEYSEVEFTPAQDGLTASMTQTFAAADLGEYEFALKKAGTWTSNGSGTTFDRDHTSAIIDGEDGYMKIFVDVTTAITFTWTYATNTLTITFPEIEKDVIGARGTWNNKASVGVFTDNGETASWSRSLSALEKSVGSYLFRIVKNGTEITINPSSGNYYTFHRDHTSAVIDGSGDKDMLIQADVTGTYTFTWTYATNTLLITYPEQPAATYYVAGTLTDWEDKSKMAQFNWKEGSVYTTSVNIASTGTYEFKINRYQGYLVEYCGENNGGTMTDGNSTNWTVTTGTTYSLFLNASKTGDYTFDLDIENKKLSVIYPSATALDNTADEAKAVKRIVNGQLVIEREGKLFNALGAEVK